MQGPAYTVQDASIEEDECAEIRNLIGSDADEVVLHIDTLGRRFVKVGDTYVRVGSFTDPELRLPSRITRIIDVAPLVPDNDGKALVEYRGSVQTTDPLATEQTGPQLLLTGPSSEPLLDLIPRPRISLFAGSLTPSPEDSSSPPSQQLPSQSPAGASEEG